MDHQCEPGHCGGDADYAMPPDPGKSEICRVAWLPFPGVTAEQRNVLIRWLYSAADRETHRQRQAARAQDRVRHSIRGDAFRDAITQLEREAKS